MENSNKKIDSLDVIYLSSSTRTHKLRNFHQNYEINKFQPSEKIISFIENNLNYLGPGQTRSRMQQAGPQFSGLRQGRA